VHIEDDKDYYRLSESAKGDKLPVKWMAVESLMNYKFSEASDVVCETVMVVIVSGLIKVSTSLLLTNLM